VLAFLVIAGFMYWLNISSEPSVVAVAEEEPTIDVVSVSSFAQNPTMYTGTPIQLTGVEVVDNVGSYAFFFGLPDGGRYLARLSPSIVSGGLVVLPGDRGTLVGTVQAMTDTVFEAWTQEGIFVGGSAAQRDSVGAVESFFQVEDAQFMASAGMAGDSAAPAGAAPPGN
jgi:hypothetical protein